MIFHIYKKSKFPMSDKMFLAMRHVEYDNFTYSPQISGLLAYERAHSACIPVHKTYSIFEPPLEYKCDVCNCNIKPGGMWRHQQTKKHKNNLAHVNASQ